MNFSWFKALLKELVEFLASKALRPNTLVLLALAFAMHSTYAYSRLGNAAVHDVGGTPCFGVADAEDSRAKGQIAFAVLSIFDEANKQHAVWEMQWLQNEKIINKSTCFRYGEIIQAAEGNVAPALVPGKIYLVSMNAHPVKRSDSTFAYQVRFCLSRNANGDTRLHELTHLNKADTDDGVCADALIK